MKQAKWVIGLFLAGLALFAGQAWADGGVSGVPGSADDPVVTKSYVDEQIRMALGGGAGGGQDSHLVVEQLKPGQTLYGFAGTEFIVRTGKVVAVSGANGDGLADITAGTDLRSGALVGHNHLLLAARSDSRGLRLAPGYQGTAYIMIRGKYEIR